MNRERPEQNTTADNWVPEYAPWRHGGSYVTNVGYISGHSGCVSRNFPDRKWRIVCDPRPFEQQPTFRTRDEAAHAERAIARSPERAIEDLRSEYDHYATMVGRFGPEGATAALHNLTRTTERYLMLRGEGTV